MAEEYERVCRTCGRTFLGYQNRVYCSSECAKLGKNAEREREREARRQLGKTCVNCGKRFYPKHRLTKTCSEECARQWESKRREYARPLGSVAICDECGRKYIVKAQNARYCGPACKKKANHRQTARDCRTIHAMTKPCRRPPALLTLEAVAREATKRGLSYGQYVARLEAGEI